MDAPQLAAVLQAAEAAERSAEAVSETERASEIQQRQQQQQQQQQQGPQHQPVQQQRDRGLAPGPDGVHAGRQQEAAAAGLRMAVLTSAARLLEAKVTFVHGATSMHSIARTH
jgi:hypothetical protein